MVGNLLDISDLSKLLKIPEKTIRNKLSDNTWPMKPLRIGRAVRWRESDVNRVIAELAAEDSNSGRPNSATTGGGLVGTADQRHEPCRGAR